MTTPLSRAGTAVSLAGSAATTTGGLMMAQAPSGSVQGNAGIVVAICGMVSVLAPLFFRDRADERASNVRDLRRENAELKEKLAHLEVVAEDVPVNTARIAANEGKTEAIEETLRSKGFLAPPPAPAGPRRTVLIVEDDPDTARALLKLLTREGFSATFAATLEEGTRLLDFGPHWMLLDLKVQGQDGLALLRRVRDEKLPTRVAVITAAADPDRIAAVEALRPDALLRKPVPFANLLAVLAAPPEVPA